MQQPEGVYSNSTLSAGSGSILIRGTGGDTVNNNNHGINISAGTINTSTGNINFVGIGAGTGGSEKGIVVSFTGAVNTLTGAISMTGTGGLYGTDCNAGVDLSGFASHLTT